MTERVLALCLALAVATPVYARDLTITIPDNASFLDGVAEGFGYAAQIPDPNNPSNLINNPQTKLAFVKDSLVSVIRRFYQRGKSQLDTRQALIDAATDASNQSISIQ